MAYNRSLLIILLFFGLQTVSAQVNRYMVFFKNKNQSIYNTSTPLEFLSQKAIERRIKQNIEITENDFPVNKIYVDSLKSIGVTVLFKTRWKNGALIQCDQSLISSISNLGFINSYELVAPGEKKSVGSRIESNSEKHNRSLSQSTTVQLEMLGIDAMHQQGYHGEGVVIAVLDSGFPGVDIVQPFDSIRVQNKIDLKASYNFVSDTENVFEDNDHGTQVLSVLAAYKKDNFIGAAYGATFQLYVTEDVTSEYRVEEYNWLFAAERADSAGADIISTSLGYNTFDNVSMNYQKAQMNGATAVITQAAQAASDRGILVVCSAGNDGSNNWKIIDAPADAKDVLAVANVNALGVWSFTSSIGPSADGRIKPDLAALGTNVSVITTTGSVSTNSGTSFASPLVAGLAAGVWQHYPYLTNKELIDLLKKTASQANTPDNTLGYGIPNFNTVKQYLSEQRVFKVYPNPFVDRIHIQLKNQEKPTRCNLDLLSQQGMLIDSRVITFDGNYDVNFEMLSSGLYFLRFSCEKDIFVIKIFKR